MYQWAKVTDVALGRIRAHCRKEMSLADAQPWRMSADDYLNFTARLPLVETEVAPARDANLGAAMRHRGLAVHEEAVLGGLLDSLWP